MIQKYPAKVAKKRAKSIIVNDPQIIPEKKIFLPEDIRRIRTTNHLSQPVFALMLGIGKTTVQQWEQGVKKPGGAAKRLLDVIDRKGIAVLS